MRRVLPHERGSPKQLQDSVRNSNLELIHLIMQAVENEHEYL